MDQDRWQKVKELFAQAERLPAYERVEFLDRECPGDPDLRCEIDSILAAHEQGEHLIELNALDLANGLASISNQLHGKQIGHYTIISEIGRGGMGAVFLAKRSDGEFDQKVALKVVRQSFADSDLIRRFKQERQILAALNHPNIARLLDGGVSAEGEPFLVMEYVEGSRIDDFCREHQFSVDERLKLFLNVCHAVSYAHQNLVVHRDIKPSNIIVTKDGTPKLLDFGIAKLLDESNTAEQTKTDQRAFTPAYAAPEQILGKTVTTVSDVYCLGVVFYELLTGIKPFHFDGKSLDQIVQTITDGEPAKPSSIDSHASRLNTDIDNIALKCLQKEPGRRYRSVEEFAGDIERFLDGRPIVARPATFRYRASKFLRRNKVAAASAAIVLLTLIAALGVSLWQAQVARQERDRAQRRFEDVRKLSNSLLFEITPKMERLPGTTEARELLVKRATEYLDRLARESQNDVELRSELASAYEKVGDLQGNPNKPNLSDFSGAIESYEKAYALRRSLPLNGDAYRRLAENRSESARIRFVQNYTQDSLNNFEEALKNYEIAATALPDSIELTIAYLETKLDYGQTFAANNQYEIAIPIHRQVLADIAQIDPNSLERKLLETRARAFLSNALSWNNQQPEAETEMDMAVRSAEILDTDYPSDTSIHQAVWRVYMLASSIYEGTKDDISYAFAEKALSTAKRSVESDSADTQAKQNLARAYSRIGIMSVMTGRVEQGVRELEEAKNILVELVEREPKNSIYQDDLGSLYTRFGDARKKQNDSRGALEAFNNAAKTFERLSIADEKNMVALRDLAQAIKNVAMIQADLNEKENAMASYSKAFTIVDQLRAMNALGKWDEKFFAEMVPAYEKLK